MAIDHSAVAANVVGIRERTARAAARAGRPAEDVTLVAISKTFPASAIRAAWDAGVRHFGENRVQEWEGKRAEVADLAATWHLVGNLQSNKARRAAQCFTAVDSLDSLELARRLDAALAEPPEVESARRGAMPSASPASLADSQNHRLRVLVEVRLAPEETKSGADPAGLEAIARGILSLPRLDLRGLMCIPPLETDAEQARPYFRRLRELRDALRASLAGAPAASASAARGEAFLSVLSMGMSHDFEIAIEEGATEVRIGTALFGSRG
ncbi:MAG TPA: YggS family pyridoxal phosphate enzyme [Candidatus Acidoferrales bacterium]|nr:YggS family pyridoxal phosphate enzyme [Candidatus Acidoferrales bacterium]